MGMMLGRQRRKQAKKAKPGVATVKHRPPVSKEIQSAREEEAAALAAQMASASVGKKLEDKVKAQKDAEENVAAKSKPRK